MGIININMNKNYFVNLNNYIIQTQNLSENDLGTLTRAKHKLSKMNMKYLPPKKA